MCTTYTGRLLMPTNFGVPAPEDIAVQLGRIPRFAGATPHWWSVLHHLRCCDLLLQSQPNLLDSFLEREDIVEDSLEEATWRAQVRLFVLLHDAEECATGDIPATWKGAEVKAAAQKLSGRVFTQYAGTLPGLLQAAAVKFIDRLSLMGEMIHVGPPGVLGHSGMTDAFPERLCKVAYDVVRYVLEKNPGPLSSAEPSSALVHWYLTTFEQARAAAGVKEETIVVG